MAGACCLGACQPRGPGQPQPRLHDPRCCDPLARNQGYRRGASQCLASSKASHGHQARVMCHSSTVLARSSRIGGSETSEGRVCGFTIPSGSIGCGCGCMLDGQAVFEMAPAAISSSRSQETTAGRASRCDQDAAVQIRRTRFGSHRKLRACRRRLARAERGPKGF